MVVSIRLSSRASNRSVAVSSSRSHFGCSQMVSIVQPSANERWAIAKNCAFSLLDSRVHPSATLAATDTAARVICERTP